MSNSHIGNTSRNSWRPAAAIIIWGGALSWLLFMMNALSMDQAIGLAACSAGISILIYPLFGLILSFVLSGLSQIAVLLPDFFSFSKLAGLACVVAYALKSNPARDLKRALKSITLISYAAPAAWLLIITPFGIASPEDEFKRISTLLSILALAFVITALPRNISQLSGAILCMSLGSAIAGVWIIFFGASGLAENLYQSIDGITVFYDHNLGIQLGLAICLSWLLLQMANRRLTIAILSIDFCLLVCVVFTNSRSTWAGLLVSTVGPVLLSLQRLGHAKQLGKFVLGISILTVALIWITDRDAFSGALETLNSRFDSLSDPLNESNGRLDVLWPQAVAYISEHPFVGAGLAGGNAVGAAHNAILEMGVEGGVAGIVIYLLSIAAMFFAAVRHQDPWIRLGALSISFFIFTVSQTNPETYYSIPYGFGVGVLAWLEIHNSQPKIRSTAQWFQRYRNLADPLPLARMVDRDT
jgi:O-antigen ligase